VFADGRRIGQPEFDDIDQGFIDGAATKLRTLTLGGQFVYEFDFGDSWTIPDRYRRRSAHDDEEHDEPLNPGSDLSPLQPMMGPTTTGLSGRVTGSLALFVRVWCEVVDTGVSTARVVPGFDPLEDRL
jgi:hypothetical protein